MTTSEPTLFVLGDRYDVIEPIGHGVAAQVYRVRDRRDGSERAAKVLHPENADSDAVLRRFEDEYRILRSLHHPNLPEVHDYGWIGEDSRYMIMDLVDGHPLDEYVRGRPGHLWITLYQICEALDFIHDYELLHQDIKPRNILVRQTSAFGPEMPLPTLLDFGLTFRRDTDMDVAMVGTLAYMAPEVIRGEVPLTRAVDYYSLGVTLYELLTGELPFTGSAKEIVSGHLKQQPAVEHEELEHAELYPHVYGLMSKDKRERLEAFEDFKRAVSGRIAEDHADLETAYALSAIRSIGLIGKDEAEAQLVDWLRGIGTRIVDEEPLPPGVEVEAAPDASAELASLEDLIPRTDAAVQPAPAGDALPAALMLTGESTSGKSFLVEQAVAECALRGCGVVRLGQESNYRWVAGKMGPSPEEQWIRVWNHITKSGRRGLLVVDGDDLDDDERAFWDYARNRIGLGRHVPLVLVAGQTRALWEELLGVLPAGESTVVTLTGPTEADVDAVANRFRGKLVVDEDLHQLGPLLAKGMGSSGLLIQHLLNSVLAGGLRRDRGRWRIVPSAVPEPPRAAGGDYVTEVYAGASEQLQSILATLACQEAGQPVSALAAITGYDVKGVLGGMESLAPFGIVRASGSDADLNVEFSTNAGREAIYGRMEDDQRRDLHERALSYWRSVEPANTQSLVAQAHHWEALGDARAALTCRVKAIKHARAVGDDMPVREIALHVLRAQDAGTGSMSRHLRMFFLKELLGVEMRRTNSGEICRILDREYLSHGREIPVVFLSRYAGQLKNLLRADDAVSLVRAAMGRFPFPDSVPALLTRIQLAWLEYGRTNYEEAIELLDGVERRVDRLPPLDRSRLRAYQFMVRDMIGKKDMIDALVEAAEEMREQKHMYDYLLIESIRANQLNSLSRFDEAMGVIARTLRSAVRHHDVWRQQGLYSMASAVYFEMGDYRRSLRALTKARRIAEDLGQTATVASLTLRIAMNNQSMGLYGNAARFARQALELAGESRAARHARLVVADLAVVAHAEGTAEAIEEATEGTGDAEVVNRVYGGLIRIRHLLNQRSWEVLWNIVEDTRRLAESVAFYDDAARAMLLQGWGAIEAGDRVRYQRSTEYVKDAIQDLPIPSIRGEFETLQLAAAIQRDDSEQIGDTLERCEAFRPGVKEALVTLVMDRQMLTAAIHLQDRGRARGSFDRYYRTVRMMVANMSGEFDANRFLEGEKVGAALSEYRAFMNL